MLAIVHFGLALLIWIVGYGPTLLFSAGSGRAPAYVLPSMLSCLAILILFTIAAVKLWWRREDARRYLLIGLLAATTLFVYDIVNHNYQIQGMTEHGCEHTYFTWFWLDDGWSPWR